MRANCRPMHAAVAVPEVIKNLYSRASFVVRSTDSSAKCRLIPGVFGFLLQGLLGAISLTAVYFKYCVLEKRHRDSDVFICDIAKQACGGLCVHLLNLIGATLLFHKFMYRNVDACDWYFLNIILDTTLGVGINYSLLQLSSKLFKYSPGLYCGLPSPFNYLETSREETNSYDVLRERLIRNAPNFIHQTSLWVLIVTLMKMTVFCILSFAHYPLASLVNWIFNGVINYPKLKLLLVMIVVPIGMNTMQYWITDQFLQYKAKKRVDPSMTLCCDASSSTTLLLVKHQENQVLLDETFTTDTAATTNSSAVFSSYD